MLGNRGYVNLIITNNLVPRLCLERNAAAALPGPSRTSSRIPQDRGFPGGNLRTSIKATHTMKNFRLEKLIAVFSLGLAAVVVNDAAEVVKADPLAAVEPTTPAAEYGLGIRTTPPRTAQEELQGFHLPPGLTIQLVANEPLICKPLNMAFDWKGRLWVTQTFEYPYPYSKERDPENVGPRDSLIVLEDKDGDGYRETSKVFADGLNIPIGVLPYGDGAICYSIPNLYMLHDTDGDGVCDDRELLYGPFDTTRDTHGMVNSLRWSDDGWIYANHGFNNQSNVAGTDGHSISLTSGNVFRFRADGSRIEKFSNGQVNPFGMTFDRFDGIFTADCHSKPISQIIQHGCYPSFGRPHDGLGFVPPAMDHLNGSTAIAGLEISNGSNFDDLFNDQFLSGNVMTSRINRNAIERAGMTVRAVEQPDFMTSEDPWFRPVDLRLGPDGWLYVADFYNRIIGHYEVPLDNPGRDRYRGRIWRIGNVDAESVQNVAPELWKAKECIAAVDHANPTVRALAGQRLQELAHSDATDVAVARAALTFDLAPLLEAAGSDDDHTANKAMHRMLVWLQSDESKRNQAAVKQISECAIRQLPRYAQVPHATAIAAEILAQFNSVVAVDQMLAAIIATKHSDPILHATLRIWLREMLRSSENQQQVFKDDNPYVDELIDIALALPADQIPIDAVFDYLKRIDDIAKITAMLPIVARAVPESEQAELLKMVERVSNGDWSLYLTTLGDVVDEIAKHQPLSAAAKQTCIIGLERWKRAWTDANSLPMIGWFIAEQDAASLTTWPLETRTAVLENSTKTDKEMFSSFPLGESTISVLSSGPFRSSQTLHFNICGHNNLPGQQPRQLSYVELIDANTKQSLLREYVPNNDIAAVVSWNLMPFVNREVAIQIVDGDASPMYAWIAAGNFSVPTLATSHARTELMQAIHLLRVIQPPLAGTEIDFSLLSESSADEYLRLCWLENFVGDDLSATAKLLTPLAKWAWQHQHFQIGRSLIAAIEASRETSVVIIDVPATIAQLAELSDSTAQDSLCKLLASRTAWHDLLVVAIESGILSPQTLNSLSSQWWQANGSSEVVKRLSALRPEPPAENTNDWFAEKLKQLAAISPDLENGKAAFTKNCAQCHQFRGLGQVVGPQLEGVGGRGSDRLCEDIMLPNRNVDQAFRSTIVMTDSGSVLVGLERRRDDRVLVLADVKGEEVVVPLDTIEQSRVSNASLMPDNFGQSLTTQQLADILAYLRSNK